MQAGPVADDYVVLGGYATPGDGGGGPFLRGASGCGTGDGGIVFPDGGSPASCFYRSDPTYSVREWGALCDVAEVDSTSAGAATWQPGTLSGGLTTPGTLVVPAGMIVTPPKPGQYIAISQIGGPTIWANSSSGAHPAASLTRYSVFSAGAQGGYKVGDLISFQTDNHHPGAFSQQAAIIVDAVNSGGTITQWHFLWGGVYDAGNLPTPTSGALVQDDAHSHCANTCGTGAGEVGGATMTPSWSGWSVLNGQTITGTSGYHVGDTVTLTGGAGSTVYRNPRLIVEGVNSGGGVTAFDWLDYGSFSVLPANPTTLSDTGSGGLALGSVGWTRGPFATTIASVTTTVGGTTLIVLTDSPPTPFAYPYPYTLAIQSFYYGDDDYAAINKALLAKPAQSLVIPAGCGTTQPLNLAHDSSANNDNPALVGTNSRTSGIYAFAYPLSLRHTGAPVLSKVVYSGLQTSAGTAFQASAGGGLRDLFVEGFGIPEGYGYYGLAGGATAPSGYQGPSAPPYLISTAGTAVEIDAASQMLIDNVHIADGGLGAGDADLQCGLSESDPTGAIGGAMAEINLTNSRLDTKFGLAGPDNPDFGLRIDAACRGSVFRNLVVEDGLKADVMQYDGNLVSQVKVDSQAVGTALAGAPAVTINWATIANFGLAGAADYGIYARGDTSISQTVCGIAGTACVLASSASAAGAVGAIHITDTQMRCSVFTSVPSGYAAVELAAGIVETTVSGTASTKSCAAPPAQVVVLDNPADFTSARVSLCNNSNAPTVGCTGYQGGFAAGQFYTQPMTSNDTISVTGSTTLYAVPFFSPASGGPVTRLAIDVVGSSSATCDVGVYNAINGAPDTLIADGGTLSGTGTLVTTAPLSPAVTLAPQRLYFLAVGCSGTTVSLLGARNGVGALNASLIGGGTLLSNSTQITSAWTFSANHLPATFSNGGAISVTSGSVPSVFAGP